MKTIKLFVYALVVCMSFVGVAEAKGRSGSFKSGFSSQKRAAPKPANTSYQTPPANAQNKQAAFGSFGATNPKLDQNTAAMPQSRMSQDLNAKTAQTNAMKTVDERSQGNSTANAGASESGWFRSGNQNATTQKNGPAAANTQAANTYRPAPQQQSNGQGSSGLLPAIAGFMIGHSLAQQHNTVAQQPPHDQVNVQSGQSVTDSTNANGTTVNETSLNETSVNGTTVQQVQDLPVVEPESVFMKLLRLMLWLAIIGGVVWLVRSLSGMRNSKVNRKANYSLGS